MIRILALFIGVLLVSGFDAPNLSPGEVVQMWTQLYAKDTAQAALLTTGRFRQWQEPERWAEKRRVKIMKVRFQHLGGEIAKTRISEKGATIFFNARVKTALGVITRLEVYDLRRIGGRWLIDAVRVTDEVRPREASALACVVRNTPRFI